MLVSEWVEWLSIDVFLCKRCINIETVFLWNVCEFEWIFMCVYVSVRTNVVRTLLVNPLKPCIDADFSKRMLMNFLAWASIRAIWFDTQTVFHLTKTWNIYNILLIVNCECVCVWVSELWFTIRILRTISTEKHKQVHERTTVTLNQSWKRTKKKRNSLNFPFLCVCVCEWFECRVRVKR